jgi:N-methylhydantoinase A
MGELVRTAADGAGDGLGASEREVHFSAADGPVLTPVLPREAVGAEERPGPMVVEDRECTILVPPGWRVRVDDSGNVLMRFAEDAA